jgi:peptidoglycan-N-acetylglucosamine deacetylase
MGVPDSMKKRHPIAPACFIGVTSHITAAVFFFISPEISAAVLSGFIAVCLAAPFFPGAGIFLPVIRRGIKGSNEVAITFDDGPHPRTTPLLLKILARRGLKATFFVIGRNAEKYQNLIREILHAGHCIGNHTFSHDVLIMAKSGKKLGREIDSAQEVFKKFGIYPLAFRPPAGVVNPKLGPLLRQREMICIHYSCRGPDMGNRRIRGLSEKILKKIRPGDIVLLHDSCPDSRHFKVDQWLNEIEKMLEGISKKGLRVAALPEFICRPVMLQHENG